MKTSEICVPLAALALPSEAGSDVSPAQGDDVDFSGTATVSRVEGEGEEAKAYLTVKTVNGEEVQTAAAPKKNPTLDDEEDEMRRDAQATDKAGSGHLY